MLTPLSTLTRRVLAAIDATPSRIPVILGGCGSGRTTLLHQLRDRIGRTNAHYINVDRTATTPERFLRAVTASTPFATGPIAAASTRAAFDATLAFFSRARAVGSEPATFLLDEFLELRTFESFPGLRPVLHDFVDGLVASQNRFILTSRYSARALRLLHERSPRFEVIHVPALTVEDTLDMLGLPPGSHLAADDGHDAEYTARAVQALADGRPAYVCAIADELTAMRERGGPGASDVVSALAALIAPEGRLARQCAFSYELRLHRARGYGALKAILEILAEDEGRTLTEISQQLQRTPGSTKDYLSWLEDVDLVTARHKRYSYTDPLLRVWVRLHGRTTIPTEEDVAREVHRYALPRLPQQPEPALVMVSRGSGGSGSSTGSAVAAVGEDVRKNWGIIEID